MYKWHQESFIIEEDLASKREWDSIFLRDIEVDRWIGIVLDAENIKNGLG
jgi:hypothetical protein